MLNGKTTTELFAYMVEHGLYLAQSDNADVAFMCNAVEDLVKKRGLTTKASKPHLQEIEEFMKKISGLKHICTMHNAIFEYVERQYPNTGVTPWALNTDNVLVVLNDLYTDWDNRMHIVVEFEERIRNEHWIGFH